MNISGFLDKDETETRSISFTGLSSWIGTLSPLIFIPVPVSEFYKVFEHLFNVQNLSQKGFHAFSEFLYYCQSIREEFRNRVELEWIYLNQINTFRTSIQLQPKNKYDTYCINWIV